MGADAQAGTPAIHLMTTVGKAVVTKYYGMPQKRAYFHGCSAGGWNARLGRRHLSVLQQPRLPLCVRYMRA